MLLIAALSNIDVKYCCWKLVCIMGMSRSIVLTPYYVRTGLYM